MAAVVGQRPRGLTDEVLEQIEECGGSYEEFQRFFQQHADTSGSDSEGSDGDLSSSEDDPLKALCPADIFHDGDFEVKDEEAKNKRAAKLARERFYHMCAEAGVRVDLKVRAVLDHEDTKPEVMFFLFVLLSRNLRADRDRAQRQADAREMKARGDERAQRLTNINIAGVDPAVVERVFRDIDLLLEYWQVPIPRVFYESPASGAEVESVLEAQCSVERVMEYWETNLKAGNAVVLVHLKHLLSDLCSILDYLSKLVMMASEEYQLGSEDSRRELLFSTGYNNLFIRQLEAAGEDVTDLISHQALMKNLKSPRNYSTHHGLHLLLGEQDPLVEAESHYNFLQSPASITGVVEKVAAVIQRCRALFYPPRAGGERDAAPQRERLE